MLAVLPLAAADLPLEGHRWWSRVEALASDNMEGRNAGSPAYLRAAQFLAGEFERAGLQPAGIDGYFQSVGFNVAQIDESASSLALVKDGKEEPLTLGLDANLGVRAGLAERLEAPLVFVGLGLSIPGYNVDDLAGLDLTGKVAVFIAGSPQGIPSPVSAHFTSLTERWRSFKEHGAIGYIAIANPKSQTVPWERASAARLNATMALSDSASNELSGLQFSATYNPDRVEHLFAASGHSFAELLALADQSKKLPIFPLHQSIKATEHVKLSTASSPNVVGVWPGSDPKLKSEYVVFGAHLDHLGVNSALKGDNIFNGAMDDGSGIASLIEIATMLKEEGLKPRRSILFVAVVGEEKGLLGSNYFSNHPTVQGRIVADINMDMFLPLFPLRYLEVQGLDESTLGDTIRKVGEARGVTIQADKDPSQNLFRRSDQYSYVKKGIPALAFKFGYLPGTPEEASFKAWYKERYHAPADDLNQPVDREAAAEFNRLLLDLGMRVASDDAAPHWKPDSFFSRFAMGN